MELDRPRALLVEGALGCLHGEFSSHTFCGFISIQKVKSFMINGCFLPCVGNWCGGICILYFPSMS